MSANLSVRIGSCAHHTRNTCSYDCINARRSLSPMCTRLEVHVQGCASYAPARILYSFNLCVWKARAFMESVPDDVLAAGNNGSHHWVRTCPADSFPCQQKRFIHKARVFHMLSNHMRLRRCPIFCFFVRR